MEFENKFDEAYVFYTTYGYFGDEENFKILENIYKALKRNGSIAYFASCEYRNIYISKNFRLHEPSIYYS